MNISQPEYCTLARDRRRSSPARLILRRAQVLTASGQAKANLDQHHRTKGLASFSGARLIRVSSHTRELALIEYSLVSSSHHTTYDSYSL